MFNIIDRNPGFGLIQYFSFFRKKSQIVHDGDFLFFGYGRGALFAVLKSLELAKDSAILVPSYICDVVINQIKALHLYPIYYAVDENLRIDFDSLTQENLKNSKVLITVNYFGLSQDYSKIVELINESDLLWVNDNAHGFSSRFYDMALDAYGDVSITSFRKSIPSLNGAYLKINKPAKISPHPIIEILDNCEEESFSFKALASKIFGIFKFRLKKYPDFSNYLAFKDSRKMHYKINEESRISMLNIDVSEIRQKRAVIYVGLKDFIEKDYPNIRVPSAYEEGNAPLSFPIIVNDREKWKRILEISRKEGIDIHTWPSLPDDVLSNNICGAYDLWQKLLFLPLHQNLELMAYIDRLKTVFSKMDQYE